MRARVYTRVSTEEQASTGFSLSAQRERLEAYCLSQGWEVAAVYTDEGASGKDLNRPAFRRLMAEAEPGDVVLVYKLDRLTRSVRDLDGLLQEFDRRELRFRSATEVFETTTATGRLFIRIVAELAQWERETIAERTSLGKRKKAETGEWPGGRTPFGYSAIPSGRVKSGRQLLTLVPDPATRHLIPMIFDRYLSGHGLRGVARWLNEELGARTPLGNRFHRVTLSRILTNPVYCGDLVQGRRAGAAGARVRGTHEPLVTREVFEQVQSVLGLRKTYAPRQATGEYPLSGVARCGVCGGRIDGQRRGARSAARVYRCHNYLTGTGCGGPPERPLASLSAERAEQALVRALDYRLIAPPDLPRLQELFRSGQGNAAQKVRQEQKRLGHDLARAETAVERWKRLYEAGGMEAQEYLAEVGPLKKRIGLLRERLAGLEGASAAPAKGTEARPAGDEAPQATGPGAREPTLAESWHHLQPPERKALLQHFVRAYQVEIRMGPGRRVALEPAPPPAPGPGQHRAAGKTPGRNRATPHAVLQTNPG